MHHTVRGDFALDTRLFRITLIAALIGALGTVAARALLDLIHLFTNLFFFGALSTADRSPAAHTLGAAVIVVPVIGGLLIGLMALYGSEKIRGHGIPEAIEAILFGKSTMSAKVAVLKPLSSGIVIGSGGPFGAEGPIIMTGGAIGSLLAQHFHLSAAERKALLVAGATAGMTAVFGTPVAAVSLAVELLLFELRPRSLLPVAVACAVAGFTRPLLVGAGPLFPLETAAPGPLAMLSCVAAGVACGALSATLSVSLYKVEDFFGKLPLHWMWWPAIGGLAVGIGGYLEPRALGVGYDVIDDLLHNHLALSVVVALLGVKAVIWAIALGSGTSGGVLAPLLMMGAGLGVAFGHVLPGQDTALWPLVCMAATLGGTMRASHRHRLRVRAHARRQRIAADLVCVCGGLRLHRADDAPLHPHREDRAPGLSHLSRVRRRPAGAACRRGGDDAPGAKHRCGDGCRTGHVRPLRIRAGAPCLSGGARRPAARHGGPRRRRRAAGSGVRGASRGGVRLNIARIRAAGRNLPRRRHATRAPAPRAPAGGLRCRLAPGRGHRLAQRPDQALRHSLRRGGVSRTAAQRAPGKAGRDARSGLTDTPAAPSKASRLFVLRALEWRLQPIGRSLGYSDGVQAGGRTHARSTGLLRRPAGRRPAGG